MVLAPTGYAFSRAYRVDTRRLLVQRQRLSRLIAQSLDFETKYGPFKGLRLIENSVWSPGDLAVKLLGVYEQELFSAIGDQVARAPDCILNIGAADGYYAVALKRLLSGARVVAYDMDPRAASACHQTAQLNGVSIEMEAAFSLPDLFAASQQHNRVFVLMDCEGCEDMLLRIEQFSALGNISFLIECHDQVAPGVTDGLKAAMETSHTVEIIYEGSRNPNALAELNQMTSIEKYLLCCEFRGTTMNWLYAVPKESGSKKDIASSAQNRVM